MGLFGGKTGTSWRSCFERFDQYQVNANRGKGATPPRSATTSRSIPHHLLVRLRPERAYLEGAPGPDRPRSAAILTKLIRDLPTSKTVRQVLSLLEKGQNRKGGQALEWTGYPTKDEVNAST